MQHLRNYGKACKVNGEVRLTKQVFSIMPKIREVDMLLRQSESLRARVFEVHPEVSFWAANDHQAMRFSTKKPDGKKERKHVLQNAGLNVQRLEQCAKSKKGVELDDVLDAAIAAWSAWRILNGDAVGALDTPEKDKYFLEMQIRY